MKYARVLASGLGLAVVLTGFNPSDDTAEAGKRHSASQLEQAPDTIVFMVDDLGFIEDERVLKRLPSIRETFLDGGLRFLRMYNESPLCCPARANFQTGQHTLRNGVDRNDGDLLNPRTTINFAMQESGYQTFMAGKYYNNYDGARHPVGWDRISIFYRHFDRLTSLSPEWVNAASKDKPVFAWFSTTAPHAASGVSRHPFVEERHRGAEACKGIANFKPPNYRTWESRQDPPRHMPNGWKSGWRLVPICESLLATDEMVEAVVRAQQKRGRPAYYILMSDNGMSWGQKGYPDKRVPTAVRLPFYVAGPGIKPGSATNKFVSIIDIAPTLAEIAGADLTWKVDGESFLPLLKGQKFSGRIDILHYYKHSTLGWSGITNQEFVYFRWSSGKKELYGGSRDDYWQRRNLAKKLPNLVREMDRRLIRLLKNARS